MNIIENVWHILKEHMRSRTFQPTTKDEMWQLLEEEWGKLGLEYCESLYNSYVGWISTLWHAKGGYTKY